MKKRLLALVLTLAMVFGLMSTAVLADDGADATHICGGSDCLVCNVADKINALPASDSITLDNAAAVTDQIHAIDRIKVDLTDSQYEELLTLVDQGDNGSGGGLGVPVRYMEAVEAIRNLTGGGSLYIGKSFISADGSTVDVSGATVQLRVTNVDSNASQTLTMSTMPGQMNTLSADADYYSESASGWTYKYILPAGTYRIEEISDSGAVVNGQAFVTTSTSYSVNGTESTDGATVTIAAGNSYTLDMVNGAGSTDLTVKFVDKDENPVEGAELTLESDENTYAFNDEYGYTASVKNLMNDSYLLTITTVPEGYKVSETNFDLNLTNPSVNELPEGVTYEYNYQEGTLTIMLTPSVYDVKVSAIDPDGNPLSGVHFQVINKDYEVEHEADNDTTGAYTADRLEPDTYILLATQVPDGYRLPELITFTLDEDGTVTIDDGPNGKINDDGVLQVTLEKKLSLTFTSDLTLVYGQAVPSHVKITYTETGEPYTGISFAGLPFQLITDYQPGDPVGTYKATVSAAEGALETIKSNYNATFQEGTITVTKKELTADDFEVTVQNKTEDGTTDAVITAKVKADSLVGEDALTVTVTGSFADAKVGENKTVSYTITGIQGDAAQNYKLSGPLTGTLTASIKAPSDTGCDGGKDCPSRAFTDLSAALDKDADIWWHEAIDYALTNKLMQGMGNGLFEPDRNLSRAMIVQVLYNLEGKPDYKTDKSFDDVGDDAWYTEATLWAAENDIVEGYGNGKFGPEDDITREQMAAVLYRYARFKGIDVSAQGDLTSFTDGAKTSDWAKEEMQWAVQVGLLQGNGDGTLNPLGAATRAEVAQIFMNFCTKILKK